jgi:hypothetical protein
MHYSLSTKDPAIKMAITIKRSGLIALLLLFGTIAVVVLYVNNLPMKSIDWHITGQVKDGQTQKTISNVTISVISDDRGLGWQTIHTNYTNVTDSDGRFDIRCHGQYVFLSLSHSNYLGDNYLYTSRHAKTGITNLSLALSSTP